MDLSVSFCEYRWVEVQGTVKVPRPTKAHPVVMLCMDKYPPGLAILQFPVMAPLSRRAVPMSIEPCLTAVVPCYNEEATVRRLLETVLASPLVREVIVVDDGSTDRTNEENRFGIEPEITAKVAAGGWRIYDEGKKIGWRDGMRATYSIVRYSRQAKTIHAAPHVARCERSRHRSHGDCGKVVRAYASITADTKRSSWRRLRHS